MLHKAWSLYDLHYFWVILCLNFLIIKKRRWSAPIEYFTTHKHLSIDWGCVHILRSIPCNIFGNIMAIV